MLLTSIVSRTMHPSWVQLSSFEPRKNVKNALLVMSNETIVDNNEMSVPLTVEMAVQEMTLKKTIGYVHRVKMSTSHGERNATVAVNPKMVM